MSNNNDVVGMASAPPAHPPPPQPSGFMAARVAFQAGLEPPTETLGQVEPQNEAERLERLGWEAIARGHQAWGFIALRSAAEHYAQLDHVGEAEHLKEICASLAASFTPYDSDEALLDAIRTWAMARLAELRQIDRRHMRARDQGEEEDDTTAAREGGGGGTALDASARERVLELRHRWMFRLRAGGDRLACLRMAEALTLEVDDLLMVLVLAAIETSDSFRQARRRWFNNDAHYTAGLVVRLLSAGPEERVRYLERLDIRRPLMRHRLVYLNTPDGRPFIHIGERFIDLDEAVMATLDGRDAWPPGIDNVVRLYPPEPVAGGHTFFADAMPHLNKAMNRARSLPSGAAVAICSPSAQTTRLMARTWSHQTGRPILEVAAHWLFAEPSRFEAIMRLAVREALLRDADLLIDGNRAWSEGGRGAQECLRAIGRSASFLNRAILLDAPREGDDVLQRHLDPLYEVRLTPPNLDQQVMLFEASLAEAKAVALDHALLRRKVCDMALNIEDIHRAVRLAVDDARLHQDLPDEAPAPVQPEAIKAVASSHLNAGMAGIAKRVPLAFSWTDVVLPDDVLDALMNVITYSRYQQKVFEEWGFGQMVPYGRANSSLFTGPPGTGKTMTAGIIARELGMDLFQVDLSALVSKYIGETEKNLGKVFEEASNGHAVILFD
ncbi:MAG: AAA family ATPase, partial [Myxococcota bacterium]